MSHRIPVFMVDGGDRSHLPLGLGMLRAQATEGCSGDLGDHFRWMPPVNMPVADAVTLARAFGPGVWLFSSFVWSVDRMLAVSGAIKAVDARNLTIHGGPSTPSYEGACGEFLGRHPHIDVAVRGEGELTLTAVLRHLAGRWGSGDDGRYDLEGVRGVTYRRSAGCDVVIRTPDADRIHDLDALPSPYLSGVFEAWTPPPGQGVAVLETNRGCPYGCTFCDWGGLIQQKVKTFGLDRVKAEIEWFGRKRMRTVLIADANFGILERDLEIAEHIARAHRRYGYPKRIGPAGYAKNLPDRVVDIVADWRAAGLICDATVSLQSTDPITLQAIDRTAIRTDRFAAQLSELKRRGMSTSIELMLGLPGQTVASFRNDLQRAYDLNVLAYIWPTRMLPNSPMAAPDYRRRHRLEVDEEGYVVASSTFSRDEYLVMKALRDLYLLSEQYSYLRYVVRFVQWERASPACELLHTLALELLAGTGGHPEILRAAVRSVPEFRTSAPDRMDELYEAIASFVERVTGRPRDSALTTVLEANRAVMPDSRATYPLTIELEHDLMAYLSDRVVRSPPRELPLSSYGPTKLTVSDPGRVLERLSSIPKAHTMRTIDWELASPLFGLTRQWSHRLEDVPETAELPLRPTSAGVAAAEE